MANLFEAAQNDFMNTVNNVDFNDPSTYHDRILVVEGKKFYVLKEVLSFGSEYFRGLFNGNFAETTQKEIDLKDVSAESFAIFLKLLYPVQHGQKILSPENIADPSILLELVALSYRFLAPSAFQEVKSAIDYEVQHCGLQRFDLIASIELVLVHDLQNLKAKIVEALQDPVFAAEKKIEILKAPEHVKDFILMVLLDAPRPEFSGNEVPLERLEDDRIKALAEENRRRCENSQMKTKRQQGFLAKQGASSAYRVRS